MVSDLIVIIPIHEVNDENIKLLKRAVDSVPSMYNVVIATTLDNQEKITKKLLVKNKNMDGHVFVETYDGVNSSDFSTLVNATVENHPSEWFSILEFDDEYTSIWFDNVEKYITCKPEVSVFLPMEDVVNFEDGKFLNFGNEAVWASSFSNEVGYIDNDCLQQFFDFYLTGSVFNTKDWLSVGGLKPSIKVSFWYEFLLRLTYNGKQAYVIPKIGYTHYVNRPTSLYIQYKETISQKESAWWFELAQQEYFFKQDRNKTYEENNKEGE